MIYSDRILVRPSDRELRFSVWTVDGLEPAHHPFTAPHPEDEKFLKTDPLKVSTHFCMWEISMFNSNDKLVISVKCQVRL